MPAVTHIGSPSVLARTTRSLAKATAPWTRSLAGRRFFPLWAVVSHQGRRSGRSYAVPVAIRVTPDAFTIPLPWAQETQWLRNVLAAGGCSIRWRGTDHPASAPRVFGFDEAASEFHPIQRAVLRGAGINTYLRLERPQPRPGG